MEKLTKLETDISYVSSLSDYPNSNDGLTSTQLKETFDKGNNDIKDFINTTLTEEIDSKFATVPEVYATKEELANVQAGQIIDGTITYEKLSEDVQNKVKEADKVKPIYKYHKLGNPTVTKSEDGKYINNFELPELVENPEENLKFSVQFPDADEKQDGTEYYTADGYRINATNIQGYENGVDKAFDGNADTSCILTSSDTVILTLPSAKTFTKIKTFIIANNLENIIYKGSNDKEQWTNLGIVSTADIELTEHEFTITGEYLYYGIEINVTDGTATINDIQLEEDENIPNSWLLGTGVGMLTTDVAENRINGMKVNSEIKPSLKRECYITNDEINTIDFLEKAKYDRVGKYNKANLVEITETSNSFEIENNLDDLEDEEIVKILTPFKHSFEIKGASGSQFKNAIRVFKTKDDNLIVCSPKEGTTNKVLYLVLLDKNLRVLKEVEITIAKAFYNSDFIFTKDEKLIVCFNVNPLQISVYDKNLNLINNKTYSGTYTGAVQELDNGKLFCMFSVNGGTSKGEFKTALIDLETLEMGTSQVTLLNNLYDKPDYFNTFKLSNGNIVCCCSYYLTSSNFKLMCFLFNANGEKITEKSLISNYNFEPVDINELPNENFYVIVSDSSTRIVKFFDKDTGTEVPSKQLTTTGEVLNTVVENDRILISGTKTIECDFNFENEKEISNAGGFLFKYSENHYIVFRTVTSYKVMLYNFYRNFSLAGVTTTGKTENTLNNMQIDTLLDGTKYYELTYYKTDNKFYAKEVRV